MSELTIKQENFCLRYIELGNATEAYRRAYNTAKMKEATIARTAHELLTNNRKITARIEELQAAHQGRHKINVDSLTDMLREDRVLARDEGEANAAINAVMAIAKLHGLVVDRKNLNVDADHKHHHTTEPLSETARWLEGVLGRGPDSPARSN